MLVSALRWEASSTVPPLHSACDSVRAKGECGWESALNNITCREEVKHCQDT